MKLKVQVKKLAHFNGLDAPYYATEQSAGMDVMAAIYHDLVIAPFKRALVPTGLQFALPPGYEMQVRPRSGLAFKHGITVLNAPGTIDADYRGEVQVLLINLGEDDFTIRRGDRIAQLIIQPVNQVDLIDVDILDRTERGIGGFGSTGA